MKEQNIPQNIDAEQAVLGLMFLSKFALEKCLETLSSELFYLDSHSKIFTVIKELNEKELKQINGGGIGIGLLITAGIVFLAGLLDGYVRPSKCN